MTRSRESWGDMRNSGWPVCDLFGLSFPLIQAGMGGVAGPGLAAAVAEAGGGGVLGLFKMGSSEIRRVWRKTRRLTERTIGVNLIPEILSLEDLTRQVDTLREFEDPRMFWTFFGLPQPCIADQICTSDRPWIVQVGSAEDATVAEELGADVVALQCSDAGGHHLGSSTAGDLLQDTRNRGVRVPLLAAGGVGNGSDLAERMAQGYDGAVCGTVFIAAEESAAHPHYKRRVVTDSASRTIITERFELGWPARPHRVLRNRTTDEPGQEANFIASKRIGGRLVPIPRFSCAVPTDTTRGCVEEMALYCGTSCREVGSVSSAQDIVGSFRKDYHSAVRCHLEQFDGS